MVPKEPEIIRDRTETFFQDRNGTVWLVTGLAKYNGAWVPRDEYLATHRIFQRLLHRGPFAPIPLEIRAYRFQSDEERHSFGVDAGWRWQHQLDAGELRSIRLEGVPRIVEGWLLGGV